MLLRPWPLRSGRSVRPPQAAGVDETTRRAHTQPMHRAAIVAAVTMLTVAMTPCSACATPADIAATHAYLHQRYVFEEASKVALPAERAALLALVARIRTECPSAATGAPHNQAAAEVGTAVLVVVSDTALVPDRPATIRFVDAVRRIHWSDGAVNRAVATLTGHLAAETRLQPPNLCAVVREWRAGGFNTPPAIVTRSIHETETASAGPDGVPERLLAPFIRSHERPLMRRIKLLETEVEHDELLSLGSRAASVPQRASGNHPPPTS
jgi:hypothetical protein